MIENPVGPHKKPHERNASIAEPASAPTALAGKDILASLSALVGLVVAAAYLQGWLILRSYFDAIGAPWFLAGMTQTHIVGEGVGALVPLGLAAVIAIERRWHGSSQLQILIPGAALAVIGMVLSIAERPFLGISAANESGFRDLGRFLFSLATGVALGEFLWLLRQGNFRMDHKLFAVAWLTFPGLLMTIPFAVGTAKARSDFDPTKSELPHIVGSSLPKVQGVAPRWRVVVVSGDTALLGTVGDKSRSFAVVKLDSSVTLYPMNDRYFSAPAASTPNP